MARRKPGKKALKALRKALGGKKKKPSNGSFKKRKVLNA